MSQIWEYIKIALMNIRSNKGRSILTMLGIIIGISSVITIISIGNGMKRNINEELNSMAGGQIYIYSYGTTEDGKEVEFDLEDIDLIQDKVQHVKAAGVSANFRGIAYTRKGDFNCNVQFSTPGMVYSSNDPIISGRYFSENEFLNGSRVCVLSESGAKSLFGTTDVVGMSFEVDFYGNSSEFTVIGIRQDNASAMINSIVMGSSSSISMEVPYMTISTAMGFDVSYISVYEILIMSESPEYASDVAKNALRLLENKYNVRGQGVIAVQNFNDVMGQMDSILSVITLFIVMVAAISLLVGGIGVMNIMLVSVTERTREIGIRKSLGARTGSILLQFLAESAIITMLGGLIGIVFGIVGAFLVCSLMKITPYVSIGTIIGATLFSSAVGIFFGIYPANKAAKLSPIEALRHE